MVPEPVRADRQRLHRDHRHERHRDGHIQICVRSAQERDENLFTFLGCLGECQWSLTARGGRNHERRAVLLLRGCRRLIFPDRANTGQQPGVVRGQDEDEKRGNQRENLATEPLPGGVLDQIQ
mgnify:CR=1 FL=1